jgi:putative transcriptional regulator
MEGSAKSADPLVPHAHVQECRIAYMQCDAVLLYEIETALIGWFTPPLNGVILSKSIDPINRIKWRLAAVMADRELDYKEVAKLTGLNPSTVSSHKNLREMPPRLDRNTLNLYCKALQSTPGELLRYVEDEES